MSSSQCLCRKRNRLPNFWPGATKKGKSTSHLVYVGDVGCEAAARWLDLNDKFAETERELALARDRVLDVIRPWHEETCARRRGAARLTTARKGPADSRIAKPQLSAPQR